MFVSQGRLIYSPRTHLTDSSRWLVLMCDDEISRYYRTLFSKQFPYLNKIQKPTWGAHISILRGEKIKNYNIWKLDEGKIIDFEYDPIVKDNGEYFWLTVKCNYLSELRIRYGLNPLPQYGFHLTIGKKEKENDT